MLDFGSGLGTTVWYADAMKCGSSTVCGQYNDTMCIHITTQDVENYCTTSRAAHQLWGGSLYETQTVDTSSEMGHMARRLRTGEPATVHTSQRQYSAG